MPNLDFKPVPFPMTSEEKTAIANAILIARKYGYGNLISHLRRAWAIELIQKYQQPWVEAVAATFTPPYPKDLRDSEDPVLLANSRDI